MRHPKWKLTWHRGDEIYRPRVIIWRYSGWWLVVRFGVERNPLFSERNQGSHDIPRRWHYLFGKRLSWWYDGS